MSLEAEELLLLSTVRRSVRPDEPLVALEILDHPEGRANFYRVAREHGVLGLSLRVLERSGDLHALPDDAGRELIRTLTVLKRQAALWDMERDRLLRLFDRSSLDFVLLKGGALRIAYYPESIERGLGDLDVLVPRQQISMFVEVAQGSGYSPCWRKPDLEDLIPSYYHIPMKSDNGFILEVHWDLDPPSSPFRLDPEAFLRHRRFLPLEGSRRAPIPRPEDLILHTAQQIKEDKFRQLKRLLDIHRILDGEPDLDWGYLSEAALTTGLNLRVGLSLQLCRKVICTEVPQEAIRELRLPWLSRYQLAVLDPVRLLVTRQTVLRGVADRSLRFWTIARWKDRLSFLLAMIWHVPLPYPHATTPASVRAILGPWKILQLVVYQVLPYLRAAGLLLTPGGRISLRFWSRHTLSLSEGVAEASQP